MHLHVFTYCMCMHIHVLCQYHMCVMLVYSYVSVWACTGCSCTMSEISDYLACSVCIFNSGPWSEVVLLITPAAIIEATPMGMNKVHYLQDREKMTLDDSVAFRIVHLLCSHAVFTRLPAQTHRSSLDVLCKWFTCVPPGLIYCCNNTLLLLYCLWCKTCENRADNRHLLLIANKAWQIQCLFQEIDAKNVPQGKQA